MPKPRTWIAHHLTVAVLLVATLAGCAMTTPSSNGDGTETTRRTIREEVPTTVSAASRTTRTRGPLPDPEWIDVDFTLEPIATAESPTALAVRTGSDDLWITERAGRVRLIQRRVSLDQRREEVKLMNTVVLDISDRISTDGEGGLLGLAFSLNGQHIYVSYTNRDGDSVIAEYTMGAITADPDSERILLTVEQPYANHNGGDITIGPDGFLYIALGDGGSGGDPHDHGQNLETMLGTILRIDPVADGDSPYGIPGGNPYLRRREVPDEVWLYGVRNPWRFSFDTVTGDLWIADVGQNEVEEVTFLSAAEEPAGKAANLGWRAMEGDRIFDDRGMDDPTLAMADYVGPVHTYAHTQGRCSITGGYVYRGARLGALQGVYVYTDFCTGELSGLKMLSDGRALWAPVNVDEVPSNPISFGQGPEGEIYVLEIGGDIKRLQVPGWRRSLRLVGPDEAFSTGGFEREVLPGDGAEERYDNPALEAPPPITFDPNDPIPETTVGG